MRVMIRLLCELHVLNPKELWTLGSILYMLCSKSLVNCGYLPYWFEGQYLFLLHLPCLYVGESKPD